MSRECSRDRFVLLELQSKEDGEKACANVRNHSCSCPDVCNETLPQVTPRYSITEPGMWHWPVITDRSMRSSKSAWAT